MSNLLPKKLWHVGRSENIEKVRVDEEKARLIEEKTLEETERIARQSRLQLLRKRAQTETIVDGAPDTDDSLVESEKKSLRLESREKEQDNSFRMSKDLSQKPWYCHGDQTPKGHRDEAAKRRLDPVYLHSTSDIQTTKTSNSSTMDELRRERLEREARERQKAAKLLQQHRRHA